LSETHLKKEEALGVQSTLQAQFKEKQNTPIFEPIVDKDSILKMIDGKFLMKVRTLADSLTLSSCGIPKS